MTFRTAIETDQILVNQPSDLRSEQTSGGNSEKNPQERSGSRSYCNPRRTEGTSSFGSLNHTAYNACPPGNDPDCSSEVASAMHRIGWGGTLRTKDFHHDFSPFSFEWKTGD
jgi:hypothetical protein